MNFVKDSTTELYDYIIKSGVEHFSEKSEEYEKTKQCLETIREEVEKEQYN